MRTLLTTMFVLFTAIAVNAQPATDTSKAASYQEFMKKVEAAKMTFVKPEGAVELPVVKNSVLRYDYALKLKDKNVEIRYSIWPLTKDFFDAYDHRQQTPGDTVFYPNRLHARIPAITYSKISGRKIAVDQVRLQNFSKQSVSSEFAGEEGNMFICPIIDTAFSPDHRAGFFIMIHKDFAGDAYIFYLYENQDTMVGLTPGITADRAVSLALKFKP